jgi:hypothetical protein
VVALDRRCSESLQYCGEDFRTASLFLRRVAPALAAGPRPAHAPLVAGFRAVAVLLANRPGLRVSLTDSPEGERLRAHFSHRIWGIPHTRIAQGVLVLPHEEGRYVQGRSRRAVRTGINKARAAGITCRALDHVEERRAAADHLRARVPFMSNWDDELFSRPGDSWWAAFALSGEPVTIAQISVDREWALLQSFSSTDRPSRYLLHTELVEMLVRANVRYLATEGPMAPLLEPTLQYWQSLLGYRIFNLALCGTRLDPEQPEPAPQVAADRGSEPALATH